MASEAEQNTTTTTTTATNNNEADETQRRLFLESLIESLMPTGTRRYGPTGMRTYQFLDAAALPAATMNETAAERKDMEFAIMESKMHFDWSKAGMVLLRHFRSEPTKYMVRRMNFAGNIPKFCDSDHFRGKSDYYQVELDEPMRREIPFSQNGFDRWIHELQDELVDAEWRRQPAGEVTQATTTTTSSSSTTTAPPDPQQTSPPAKTTSKKTTAAPETQKAERERQQAAALGLRSMWDCYARKPAKVVAFRTDCGDRLEYWTEVYLTEEEAPGYAPTTEHSYIVLHTAGGKVLIVGVTGGHPFIICNLLQFDNSDGSTSQLSSTISLEEVDGSNVLNGLIELARSYLFRQRH